MSSATHLENQSADALATVRASEDQLFRETCAEIASKGGELGSLATEMLRIHRALVAADEEVRSFLAIKG